MITEDKKPPAGMAEVSAKFVDEAEAATAAPPSSASAPRPSTGSSSATSIAAGLTQGASPD